MVEFWVGGVGSVRWLGAGEGVNLGVGFGGEEGGEDGGASDAGCAG